MSTRIDIDKENKIKAVQQKTREVSDIVRQNVDQLIANGQRLEDVEQKSLELEEESLRMRKISTKVSRTMCCQKYRNQCLLVTLILAIIGIIILIVFLNK